MSVYLLNPYGGWNLHTKVLFFGPMTMRWTRMGRSGNDRSVYIEPFWGYSSPNFNIGNR